MPKYVNGVKALTKYCQLTYGQPRTSAKDQPHCYKDLITVFNKVVTIGKPAIGQIGNLIFNLFSGK